MKPKTLEHSSRLHQSPAAQLAQELEDRCNWTIKSTD